MASVAIVGGRSWRDGLGAKGRLTLLDLHGQMADAGVRLVVAEVDDDVRAELDRDGFSEAVGADAYFDSISEVAAAFLGPDAGPVARSEDATA